MGISLPVHLLDGHIAEHKQALSKMPPDGDLRKQVEDEITALQIKQLQLHRYKQVSRKGEFEL